MGKDFEIKEDVKNPLLKRRELNIIINHSGTGTPKRLEVRNKIASKLNEDLDKVYVIKVVELPDHNSCKVLAHIYDNKETALKIEQQYIIKRNTESKTEAGSAESKSESVS